jgi:hypothetical protein
MERRAEGNESLPRRHAALFFKTPRDGYKKLAP